MTLPLYLSVGEKPPKRDLGGNAGLWFDKFCDQWQRSNGSWSIGGSLKTNWLATLTRNRVGSNPQIQEYALRMVRLVENCGGVWMVISTVSRFVTGLGRSHPVENGFAWHPTLGVPYLPGSSVKGMARAWARVDASPRPGRDVVEQVFGAPDAAGNLCFLDAVPVEPARLEIDVMTPHYASWKPEDPPGDWKSPTPIPFLVTAPATPFLFGIVPRTSSWVDDLSLAERWLRDALEQGGAGAKTAVGYGRFASDDLKTSEFGKQLEKAERQRNERLRLEREAEERAQWLDSLSPVERGNPADDQ